MAEQDQRRDVFRMLDEISNDELTLWMAYYQMKAEQQTPGPKLETPEEFEKRVSSLF